MLRKRLCYAAAFLLLLALEILIALYVHDDFIRPYAGDVLVVLVLYCFIRIFVPRGLAFLPLYLFLFATGVEILQYFRFAELMGLQENAVLRIVIGAVFDVRDIVCYAVGCGILALAARLRRGSSVS